MDEMFGNLKKSHKEKHYQVFFLFFFRKTKIYFLIWKEKKLWKTHNQKWMHIKETDIWKYTLWTYKYSFGEGCFVSPEEQTDKVFGPVWKNITDEW